MSRQLTFTSRDPSRRVVLLNVGHWRTGSTTLAEAARRAGLRVHREFPNLSGEVHRQMLVDPRSAVHSWWHQRHGRDELVRRLRDADFLGDGWVPLLPFLGASELADFVRRVREREHVEVRFVATTRSVPHLVRSGLQHWVECDLERLAGLSFEDRCNLESHLLDRATKHGAMLQSLELGRVAPALRLELDRIDDWPRLLEDATRDVELKMPWKAAFKSIGKQNESRKLPTEGILLTFRLNQEEDALGKIKQLLSGLKADLLANMMVVVALDERDYGGADADRLRDLVQSFCTLILIRNPPRGESEPFPICRLWNNMAGEAFEAGADWVVLLGDDVKVDSPFHYRATYRAFLDISKRLGCPLYFGCPWWNDTTFPGFPTFPVVGRAHYEIFGSLIPRNRIGGFMNQDLDPFLQRLYLKFGAAPCMKDARLRNVEGGNNVHPTRYKRVRAAGWREWVLNDVVGIRTYLKTANLDVKSIERDLLDVVVPSYRVTVDYLARICCLKVPERFRTTFIVIVDNPNELMRVTNTSNYSSAAASLEKMLVARSTIENGHPNNIRVRCNEANMGASASRNRGMNESSAEYVLFLDDDVRPSPLLLARYEEALRTLPDDVVGIVGMVRFPRSATLPVVHAAVLMSFLTFMFEISGNDRYAYPSWGVTANLLVKRLHVRFDTVYAKKGGGEDVDFCLRTAKASGGGRFKSVVGAEVGHDFWPGGLAVLIPHFFRWAIGDGALFQRYPEHRYMSWPNLVETLAAFSLCWPLLFRVHMLWVVALFGEAVLLFVADTLVEVSNREECRHKRLLLEHDFSTPYYACAHVLANLFVSVLELGRFVGHVRRGEILRNACRRFDWHCGCLANARRNFRRKEGIKFAVFLVASAAYVLLLRCFDSPNASTLSRQEGPDLVHDAEL
jgi:glycosyltransferase involved in cell wall biosynthesis